LVFVAVGVAITVVIAWWIRRRGPGPGPPASAGRKSRGAVQRALRTGQPPDARIDALAREAADRNLRSSWFLPFCAALVLLNLGLLILRIVGDDIWQVALAAANTALWTTALVRSWIVRRRSERYLQRSPLLGTREVRASRSR
jgi:hypothetical protein